MITEDLAVLMMQFAADLAGGMSTNPQLVLLDDHDMAKLRGLRPVRSLERRSPIIPAEYAETQQALQAAWRALRAEVLRAGGVQFCTAPTLTVLGLDETTRADGQAEFLLTVDYCPLSVEV